MAITLDDVVLEQMETNQMLGVIHEQTITTFQMENEAFGTLITQFDEFLAVMKAEQALSEEDRRKQREALREGGRSSGDGGSAEGDGTFKGNMAAGAGAGVGKGLGSIASLAGLGAGIAAFIGALGAGGALVTMMGIDFKGLKKMLVGVSEAFAATNTAGFVKLIATMSLAGFVKGDPLSLGKLGLGLAAFLGGLGAGGFLLNALGMDFSGLGTFLSNITNAFAGMNTVGFFVLAGLAGISKYLGPKMMGKIGLGIAAFIAPLIALSGIASMFGADGGGAIVNLLKGLGEGLASFSLKATAALLVLGTASALLGPVFMGMIGLGIAALLLPLAGLGAIISGSGAGEGIKELLTGLGDGLSSFAEVPFQNFLVAGPALASLTAGLIALTGGTLLASIGDFIGKLFKDEDDKSVVEKLADDLSNFNKVDFNNLKSLAPAAIAIERMANALEKIDDVDGGVFSKVKNMLSDFSLTTSKPLRVQAVAGERPSVTRAESIPVAETSARREQRRGDEGIADLQSASQQAKTELAAFEGNVNNTYSTFVDPDDFFGDEQRKYDDPAVQAEYERLLEQERKTARAYRRAKDSETGTKYLGKVQFLRAKGILPQNVSADIPGQKIDEMVDNYFASLAQPSTAEPSTPPIETPPVNTAATDFVNKESVASTAASVAPPVVIQDNSVNTNQQNNTSNQMIGRSPMSSPLYDNRTRASAYATG